jgi:hypothetical protein
VEPGFDSRQEQDIFFLNKIQNNSGAHPTEGSPSVKKFHVVPMLRMAALWLHSSVRLYGKGKGKVVLVLKHYAMKTYMGVDV